MLKIYGGVEVVLHKLLTLALRCELSGPYSEHLTHREDLLYLWVGNRTDLDRMAKRKVPVFLKN
jgi:hypothetical protein